MKHSEHLEAIEQAAEALGVDPGPTEELIRFATLVALWNAKLNLTGARTPGALTDVLFVDAWMLASIVPTGAHFVDVGAGAGAPALPLLLLRPDLRGTLVEPRRNRVAFQRSAIGSLELAARAEVIEARLEAAELPAVTYAFSRATFEPGEWLERALLLAPEIAVLAGAEGLPSREGAELIASRSYVLPTAGTPREIGVFRGG